MKTETSNIWRHYVNGVPYKQDEAGEWIVDKESQSRLLEYSAAENKRKDDLYFALRSRVLSSEEMAEVQRLGTQLLVRMNGGMSQSYREDELEKRLNEALLQQLRLQAVAPPKSYPPRQR